MASTYLDARPWYRYAEGPVCAEAQWPTVNAGHKWLVPAAGHNLGRVVEDLDGAPRPDLVAVCQLYA